MTADTKPEADALLPCPWCRSVAEPLHRPSAVTKWQHRIVCRGTTCGAEGPVEASEAKAIAAWNTRAALSKPSVAPDDEARFTALQRCVSDSYGDDRDSQQVYEEGGKALEALRRHIAGLRDELAGMTTNFQIAEASAKRRKSRAEAAERELAKHKRIVEHREKTHRTILLADIDAALAGDLSRLRIRRELMLAPPVAVVLSEEPTNG